MKEEIDIFCEIAEKRDGRKNILIVDDDIQMLKIFRYYLMDHYDVSVVNSGMRAMDFLMQYTPDLVLLDYMMPECNGADVMNFIRDSAAIKELPVIFLTGVTCEDVIKECLSLKPVGYVVKPIAKNALLLKLEQFFSSI